MDDMNGDPLLQLDCVIVADNMNSVEDNMLGEDGEKVSEVGMTFEDEKTVFDFCKRYAYTVGFSVRKRNSKKGDDGVLRYVTFTCSRECRNLINTSTSLKPQPTSQTDCRARINASSDDKGTWRINNVHLEHNHKTSPSKSRLYRYNRELTVNVKRKLELNDMAGIPLHKSFNSAVVEPSGYEEAAPLVQFNQETQYSQPMPLSYSQHGVQVN